ncbi:hypothetical protein, partial [Actinomadura nitritigenes]|uniref:hypothetical protein n=1 Tax=Actinomadura nitritigenes TaxID=134602 RepID=UPI003D8EBCA8
MRPPSRRGGTSPCSSLRERLLARERPSHRVALQMEDPTAAIREAALAEDAWRTCHLMQDGPDREAAIRKAKRELDKTAKAVNDCYDEVTLRAIPPAEFEALQAAHPAATTYRELRPESEEPDEIWNASTFPRALFLKCADGDLLSQTRGAGSSTSSARRAERTRKLFYAVRRPVNIRVPSSRDPEDQDADPSRAWRWRSARPTEQDRAQRVPRLAGGRPGQGPVVARPRGRALPVVRDAARRVGPRAGRRPAAPTPMAA